MKKSLLFIGFFLFIVTAPLILTAQCTPGDAISCPDPENNGEICPETLPNAIVDEPYSQEFTILAPPQYIADSTIPIIVDIHHLTIVGIDNMPEGITWVTNAEDGEFIPGTYYCVLLEGTPTVTGVYPLKIMVDVYIEVLGQPYNFGTVTDSTSLFINVTESNSVDDLPASRQASLECHPNPFMEGAELTITNADPGPASLEVFSLMGKLIKAERLMLQAGENKIILEGKDLIPGIYFASIRNNKGIITRRIIKSN